MAKICCVTTIEATMRTFVIPAMELFVDEGHDVTLMCDMSDDFIKEYSNRFKCVRIAMRRGLSLKDMITKPFEFYSYFKREKFDYVQYATTNASLYACIPAWFTRIPHRVCCLWGIAFYTHSGLKRFLHRQIEKFPCRFSTHISIPSFKNQQIGVRYKLFQLTHSSVVGDGGTVGVNLQIFDINQRDIYKQTVLLEYPQLKGKLVFGFLGRINKDKGLNELLEAFMSLENQEKIALFLIGPIDNTYTSLNNDLLEKARLHTNIIFHGFTKDVPKYLSIVDVLCHPSYHEGFSMALQQGMAMGCAILTTDIPGPSEVIENRISGITVPSKDAKALAEGMQEMTDDSLRKTFVESGLHRVRSKFTRERMIQLTYENRKDIMNGKYE
jgi:glycosyltransferase involved in cell wall biosynthesis